LKRDQIQKFSRFLNRFRQPGDFVFCFYAFALLLRYTPYPSSNPIPLLAEQYAKPFNSPRQQIDLYLHLNSRHYIQFVSVNRLSYGINSYISKAKKLILNFFT